MINVAACEPLFPPLEIINGIKVESTNTCSSVSWKLDMAAIVSVSPINNISSQIILFLYNFLSGTSR
jgi:hypothetical protein